MGSTKTNIKQFAVLKRLVSCLIVLVMVFSAMPGQLTAMAAAPSWTVTANMAAASTGYNIDLVFSSTTGGEKFTDAQFDDSFITYYLYLPKDAFNVQSSFSFNNPTFTNGVQIFNMTSIAQVQPSEYSLLRSNFDPDEDVAYKIVFNSTQAGKDAYKANTDSLASITLSMQGVTIKDPTQKLDDDIIEIDGGGLTFYPKLPTTPDPEAPAKDGEIENVEKIISGVWRLNDSVSPQRYESIYTFNGSWPSPPQIKDGDLVQFRIRVTAKDGKVTIKELIEDPGSGYDVIDKDYNFKGNTIEAGEPLRSAIDLTNQANYVDHWYKEADGKYHHYTNYDLYPGDTYTTYMYALVNGTYSDGDAALGNTVTVKPEKGDPGTGNSTYNPVKMYYDLALRVYRTAVYYKDGTIKQSDNNGGGDQNWNIINNRHDVPMSEGEIARVAVAVQNQGVRVAEHTIYLYVPEGFVLKQGTGSLAPYPADRKSQNGQTWNDANNAWKDTGAFVQTTAGDWGGTKLKIYEMQVEKVFNNGAVNYYPAYLERVAAPDEDKGDLLVGAEVGYLKGVSGDVAGGTEEEGFKYYTDYPFSGEKAGDEHGVYDIDSVPDPDPINDLNGKKILESKEHISQDGKNDPKHVTHEAAWEAKTDPSIKETQPTKSWADEDDFDFVVFKVRNSVEPPQSSAFTKRLVDPLEAPGVLRRMDPFAHMELTHTNYPASNRIPHTVIGGEAYITNPNTYMIYEFWINQSGHGSFEGGTFVDELPVGLKLYRYQNDDIKDYAKKDTYTIGVTKYVAADGNTYIDYANEDYRAQNLYLMPGGEWHMTPPYYGGSWTPHTTAETGITVKVEDRIENGKTLEDSKLTIEFDTPTAPTPNSVWAETDNVAYRIQILVVVDNTVASVQLTSTNTAKLTYKDTSSTEDTSKELIWDFAGSATFAKKYLADATGNKLAIDNIQVIDLNATRDASIDYIVRIRAETNGMSLGLTGMEVKDTYDNGSNGKAVLKSGSIDIKGHTGTGWDSANDSEMMNKTPIAPSNIKISATDYPTMGYLEILPTGTPLTENEQYDVSFTVDYSDLEYGKPIVNTAGTTVRTAVPLKLDLQKVDAANNSSLGDYEFEVSFKDEQGNVLNNSDSLYISNTTLNDTTSGFTFLPPNYTPYGSGVEKWTLVLTETVAPAGYDSNIGKTFELEVVSANGVLSFTPNSDLVVNNTTGAATFTAKNDKNAATPTDISIQVRKVIHPADWTYDSWPTSADYEGEFTFELRDSLDNVIATTVNDEVSGFSAWFTVTGLTAGTYRYTVREVAGTDPDITYDTNIYEVEYVIAPDSMGVLQVTSQTVISGSPSFINVYTKPVATTTDISVDIRKIIKYADTGIWLPWADMENYEGQFTFVMEDKATGVEVARTTNNIANGGSASLSVSGLTVGTYNYIIRELAGSDPTIIYDTKVIEVEVEVTSDLAGVLSATARHLSSSSTFENEYKEPVASTTDVTIYGKKTMQNATVTDYDGAFTFVLEDASGTQVAVANNTENRGAGFSFNVSGLTAGTYYYTVRELAGPDSAITYDTAVFDVEVVVSANLAVTVNILNANVIEFENEYERPTASTTDVFIYGEKEMKNANVANYVGDFVFVLRDKNTGGEIATTNNQNSGAGFSFNLKNLVEGTYEYIVFERAGSNAEITYDKAIFEVEVVVESRANGRLRATVNIIGATEIKFVNERKEITPPPSPPGDNGGGGDSGETYVPSTPTPTPTTPTTPSGPNPNDDGFSIGDEPAPLTRLPNLTMIFDDDMPLARLPATGGVKSFGGLGLLLVLSGAVLAKSRRKGN